MTTSPELTPAEQNLMNFLDKLATSEYSPQLMNEGYSALDAAVEESRRLQDVVTDASKTLYSTKKDNEQP